MLLAAPRLVRLAVHADLAIGEIHLAAQANGLMDGIDRGKRAFALRFDTPLHVNPAIQQHLLVAARKLFDVRDEQLRLAVRDGSARLDGIDHQHEFVDREITSLDGVFDGIALIRLHVYVELAQRLDVVVDAFAFGRHAVFRQPLDDLRHGQAVRNVGLFLQNLQEVQDFHFRFAVASHGTMPLLKTRRICTAS